MRILNTIGEKHGTDKTCHVYNGESYLDVYERYFEPIRTTAKVVLEFGVLNGSSLRTWADYFAQASIFGVDVDPNATRHSGGRISVLTGSQTDPEVIRRVAASAGPIDIVVDDGSHLVEHMIESFRVTWPHLRSGGVYAIEDLACTYVDITPYKDVWPGQRYNVPGTAYTNDRARFDSFITDFAHHLDACQPRAGALPDAIRSVHMWSNQCIILKA